MGRLIFEKNLSLIMPIDPNAADLEVVKTSEQGLEIRGEIAPPEKLGIHGSIVLVDLDTCNGDGICIEDCPEDCFEWLETPGHPLSEKKSIATRESDCIQCFACEDGCPAGSIKVLE